MEEPVLEAEWSVVARMAAGEGAALAELYASGAPIDERVDGPDGVLVRARLARADLARFARYLVAESRSAPARSLR